MDYSAFKSGSDVRGFGLGEASNPLFLSDEVVSKITFGFLRLLRERAVSAPVIAVGHDSRLSAARIKGGVIKTLVSNGARVLDCGLSSTPAMFMTTVNAACTAAIQITASHHPKDRNGLKFFTRAGGLNGEDITQILSYAAECEAPFGNENAECVQRDFMAEYASFLRKMIVDGVNAADREHPLKGQKIVVDAGNGVGGFYARDVLEPLGADVSGSLYLEPDGNFPNHAPNPENKDAMDCISEQVKNTGADFGVIFDTDVDRAACVGKGGFEINRNRLVALASCVALKICPGGTVVTDSVTSDGLALFIEKLGGVHLRFKRGYRNVINKQLELEKAGIKCPLAMETSGHAAFADNYYLDDGAYLITRLIIEIAELAKQGKSLESLIDGLNEPAEEKELRFKILAADFKSAGEEIIASFEKLAAGKEGWSICPDNYEGIRINAGAQNGNGWFLLRLSVHDPIIVFNAESDEQGGVMKICREVYSALSGLSGFGLIDASSMKDYIN